LATASLLLAAACASLVGLRDVPNVEDAGDAANASETSGEGATASDTGADTVTPDGAQDAIAAESTTDSASDAVPSDGRREAIAPETGADSSPEAAHADSGRDAIAPETGAESGTDATVDAGQDGFGGDGPPATDAGGKVCTPKTTQCVGNAVQTCGLTGQWDTTLLACLSSESCENGACTAIASCLTNNVDSTDCNTATGILRITESCCISLEVSDGGTYNRTYTNSGTGPTAEADPATVSPFRLDKYDVTVGRFRQFVAAWNKGWLPASGSGKHTHLNSGNGLNAVGATYEPGWSTGDDSNISPTDTNLTCPSPETAYTTWTPSDDGGASQENLPINCVNWYEAYAFCIWDGGFLPSEAEWEYAAAGGSLEQEYPWGDTAPGTINLYAIYGCNYPINGAVINVCSGVENIAPVGAATLGAGLWGQLDLEGNLYQWVLDWYAATYVDPCTDCAEVADTGVMNRVVRGARYDDAASAMIPSRRGFRSATTRGAGVGFRCARTP
jgi:formylglycine-generating enzyme required for sulfatase activity